MLNISEKVFVTVRRFEHEKDNTKLFKRIDRVYGYGIRKFRFNLGKLNERGIIEETGETILKLKSIYLNSSILIDIGYPGNGVRIISLFGEKTRVIQRNDTIVFVSSTYNGGIKDNIVMLNIDDLRPLAAVDKSIYYADGEGAFRVKQIINEHEILVKALDNMTIITNQSIKFGGYTRQQEITQVLTDLICAVKPEIVALSFVENIHDILKFKSTLNFFKGKVMSKIETKTGIDNLKDITVASDAVMFARGDLAYNIDLEDLYYYQMKVINEAHRSNKAVYVATDIMSSFKKRAFPSRSDVIDLTSIVLMSPTGIILNGEVIASSNCEAALELIEKVYKKHKDNRYISI